ncbi:MAG: signal recognition particle-docking protein FtsY [Candidatus Nanoarchaeia archaeon]|nr:signal recognition particle-docking protein FtsY [Candidatus Nanoarchaeia archaeon]
MFEFFKKKINEAITKVEKVFTEKVMNEKDFEKVFFDIELNLIQSNVSSEVVNKIKQDLKKELIGKSVKKDLKNVINISLKNTLNEILMEQNPLDFLKKINEKKPYIIMIIGVNGSGKTTTIGKLANYFKSKKLSVLLAACDTFRAASIEQLKVHADKLGIKLISSEYGSDSTSIAFDAKKHAEKNKIDILIIDTAGRLQSNSNLMEELKKMKRVINPDSCIFVADSITGADVVLQADKFNSEIGIDYLILSKTDVDTKGGAIISASYVVKKPILFLGTGQEYTDLKEFNKQEIIDKIVLT